MNITDGLITYIQTIQEGKNDHECADIEMEVAYAAIAYLSATGCPDDLIRGIVDDALSRPSENKVACALLEKIGATIN